MGAAGEQGRGNRGGGSLSPHSHAPQIHTLCTNSKKAADLVGQKVRELPKSTIDTLLSLLDDSTTST